MTNHEIALELVKLIPVKTEVLKADAKLIELYGKVLVKVFNDIYKSLLPQPTSLDPPKKDPK